MHPRSHCSGVGSVAAIAAMAATLFWPKKINQLLLNVYDSGNRAYINKIKDSKDS